VAPGLTLRWRAVPTPLGPLTVVTSDAGVIATGDEREAARLTRLLGADAREGGDLADAAAEEVRAYFAGRLRAFSTPVDLRLAPTPFAVAVLETTRAIPYGDLRTYGDVATEAGRPGAARAAGSVLAACPLELFVPCHRVVRAGPDLGAYGGAEDRRLALLRLEGAV
jgi:methylated-DNA-[protein]-cysteine S-methyltransferase